MVEIVLPRPAGVRLHGRLSSNVRRHRHTTLQPLSFPKTLVTCLADVGLTKTGALTFELPAQQQARISWQLSFRTLGFAKNQIDAALRYRHALSTDFAWQCLLSFAGRRWSDLAQRFANERFSGGFPVALIAGWRSDHTFDNRGMHPDESARAVAKDIENWVLPFTRRLTSDDQLLDFLVRDEEPFPWFRSQGLTRLAEVAKLEAVLDVDRSSLEVLAATHQQMLEDQLDAVSLSSYTESVRSAARSDA